MLLVAYITDYIKSSIFLDPLSRTTKNLLALINHGGGGGDFLSGNHHLRLKMLGNI